ncbi:MAG TPA: carboxypeptidase-like regulatory domain-containing protein [Bryobacteraceae bacterium]
MQRIVILMAALALCPNAMQAQMCDPNPPPPCARLHPHSIFFLGTVIDTGTDDGKPVHSARFHIDEAFLGIANGQSEIVVESNSLRVVKGVTYLIDAFHRGKDEQGNDWIDLTTCGASGESTQEPAAAVLRFLRDRAAGTAPPASLGVFAFDNGRHVPGVTITASSGGKSAVLQASSIGTAMFRGIEPGVVELSATHPHYHLEIGPLTDSRVEVLPAACPTALLEFRADTTVTGLMVDANGQPIPYFDLDLISISSGPGPGFSTRTGADGKFTFTSVSPGTFWLGANLTWYGSMDVPPTYFPGKLTQTDAVPVVVKLGESVSGLRFTKPDFGSDRTVRVCVVDEAGAPVPAVRILNPHDTEGPRRASLGETLMTDETGCATATGYTKVQYSIRASKRSYTGDPSRSSDYVVIEPGDQPAEVRLMLKAIR